MTRECRVGLLGLGTVGGGRRPASTSPDEIAAARRDARPPPPRRRGPSRPAEDRQLPDGILIGDARSVVNDPAVDVVVEVMGGIEPARTHITERAGRGKSVVTAQQATDVHARRGTVNCRRSRRGVDLFFEASVCGGIPIIKTIRESLAANDPRRSWES